MSVLATLAALALTHVPLQAADETAAQEEQRDADDVGLGDNTDGGEQVAEAESEEDRIICRRTRVVGSKFNKRICGTAEQWEQMTSRSRDNSKDMQRRGKGLSPNGG